MALGDQVSEMAASLRDCLETALLMRDDPPAETCLVPGEDGRLWLSVGTSEDRCCAGFAWVRVVTVVPDIAPTVQDPLSKCGTLVWRLDLEMGVSRCAPFGSTQAGPTCAELALAFTQQQSDAEAMREALCCFRPLIPTGRSAPTPWLPFGPDGGCMGGAMGISLQLDDCDCDN